nr:MAG TPA: hypothetical protein [Caudoviricetes sp.]
MTNEMKIGKNPFPLPLPLRAYLSNVSESHVTMRYFLILLLNLAVFPACQNKK